MFGSDRPLLYTVSPWKELGFAVPNFGEDFGTKSQPIHGLADEIGRIQLMIMTHVDARRVQPPTRNTIERLGKTCNRANSILFGRMKADSDPRLEGLHMTANLMPWLIHPVPYFDSAVLRNKWLQEYNHLTMAALTNIYQHSDNNTEFTITEKFARQIWQYFREIKILMGTELLRLDPVLVKEDAFLFTTEHYDAYKPSEVTIDQEALDSPGPIQSSLTEDDLRPLYNGIASTLIREHLGQYPVILPGDFSGADLPDDAASPGTIKDQAVAPAGGTIGRAPL